MPRTVPSPSLLFAPMQFLIITFILSALCHGASLHEERMHRLQQQWLRATATVHGHPEEGGGHNDDDSLIHYHCWYPSLAQQKEAGEKEWQLAVSERDKTLACCHVFRRLKGQGSLANLEDCLARATWFSLPRNIHANAEWWRQNKEEEPTRFFSYWQEHRAAPLSASSGFGVVPPAPLQVHGPSQSYVWANRQLSVESPQETPEWIPVLTDETRDGSWSGLFHSVPWTPHPSTTTTNYSSIHLESTLSASGGMHRDMHHTLTVTTGTASFDREDWTAVLLNVRLLLFVPPHLFLNLEEAVSPSNYLASVVESTTVLDQEEPSFAQAATWHAVVMHLQLPPPPPMDADSHVRTWVWNLTTYWHTRYPSPLGTRDSFPFASVWIPPPVVLDATLQVTNNSNIDENGTFSIPLTVSHQSKQAPPLHLWVAQGYAVDLPWVGPTTLMVCLLGAAALARSLHRVAAA